MRPTRPIAARVAGLLAGIAILVAACSTASTPSPSAAGSAAASAAASASAATSGVVVDSAQSATLGAFLTGANGMTLYVFKKDAGGKSACSGTCATTWPPLTVPAGASATAGTGVTGMLGTITRDDGSTQVTYDGAPLYYYAGDQKAGDTTGQGLNGVWFVAPVAGAAGGSPSPSAGSGGGYGGAYGGVAATPATPAASGATASIVDFGFQPGSLSVKAGTTVTWKNTGGVAHTVTADDSSFDSGHVAPGASFQHTFTTAGTYAYHCAIHPSMTATVVVTG